MEVYAGEGGREVEVGGVWGCECSSVCMYTTRYESIMLSFNKYTSTVLCTLKGNYGDVLSLLVVYADMYYDPNYHFL